MKKSLKIFIKAIITVALFAAGAILGAVIPEHLKLYIVIVSGCVAVLFFIMVGFNGRNKMLMKTKFLLPHKREFFIL